MFTYLLLGKMFSVSISGILHCIWGMEMPRGVWGAQVCPPRRHLESVVLAFRTHSTQEQQKQLPTEQGVEGVFPLPRRESRTLHKSLNLWPKETLNFNSRAPKYTPDPEKSGVAGVGKVREAEKCWDSRTGPSCSRAWLPSMGTWVFSCAHCGVTVGWFLVFVLGFCIFFYKKKKVIWFLC